MKGYAVVGPVALLALWAGASYLRVIDPLLLPAPEHVASKLVWLFFSGTVVPDLMWTVARWFSGFALGVLVGVPLGLCMGVSGRVHAAFDGIIDFFRSIPVMAMFPLFMILVGLGDRSKIALSAWTTLLYVVINTLYGVRHVSDAHRKVARVFRATPWQTFAKVVFPDALPHIFVGMRVSISMSLVLVVASEMIMGTTAGLGKRIFDAGLTYGVSEMYATILLTGILGYASNRAFLVVEHRILHWSTA